MPPINFIGSVFFIVFDALGTQAQEIRDLRVRQRNGIAYALCGFNGCRVLPQRGDSVQNVVSNTLARSLCASDQFNSRPEEHILSGAHLPLLGPRADKSRSDPVGQKSLVQLPVQEDPAPMGNTEVVAGWTFEPSEGAGCLKHLFQRLQESISSFRVRKHSTVPVRKNWFPLSGSNTLQGTEFCFTRLSATIFFITSS